MIDLTLIDTIFLVLANGIMTGFAVAIGNYIANRHIIKKVKDE